MYYKLSIHSVEYTINNTKERVKSWTILRTQERQPSMGNFLCFFGEKTPWNIDNALYTHFSNWNIWHMHTPHSPLSSGVVGSNSTLDSWDCFGEWCCSSPQIQEQYWQNFMSFKYKIQMKMLICLSFLKLLLNGHSVKIWMRIIWLDTNKDTWYKSILNCHWWQK